MSENFDIRLYQKIPQIVLGFHGCDESIAKKVIRSPTEHLKESRNDYDWLGNGIYFWQNDPVRALEWAEARKNIKKPAVIGAVIDLGFCLNLNERSAIELLKKSFCNLKNSGALTDEIKNKLPDNGGFNLARPLDCLVIENVHKMLGDEGLSFDTVCGCFQEGEDAYSGSGIKEKSHIQICIRNTQCIKGYFLPRR